jgi:protein gp37
MGDLFYQRVPEEFYKAVFRTMLIANRHTYMVLTKRPERITEFLKEYTLVHPMKHVFIGTTAGTQRSANERWNAMAWIAQAGWKTWVSSEPKLEMIDWHGWSFLEWMVTGGESGPYARSMAPAWARADRDWCQEHAVAFWFKQWGEWGPEVPGVDLANYPMTTFGREILFRFGRKLAGRLLDGREWNER